MTALVGLVLFGMPIVMVWYLSKIKKQTKRVGWSEAKKVEAESRDDDLVKQKIFVFLLFALILVIGWMLKATGL